MPPAIYNGWTIHEGSRFTETVKWPGISDATGYTARCEVRQERLKTSTLIVTPVVAVSSSGGYLVIILTITAPNTKSLNFNGDVGHIDIEIIPPAGENDTFRALQGTIRYSREVIAT
jgi:hypothetical protein